MYDLITLRKKKISQFGLFTSDQIPKTLFILRTRQIKKHIGISPASAVQLVIVFLRRRVRNTSFINLLLKIPPLWSLIKKIIINTGNFGTKSDKPKQTKKKSIEISKKNELISN